MNVFRSMPARLERRELALRMACGAIGKTDSAERILAFLRDSADGISSESSEDEVGADELRQAWTRAIFAEAKRRGFSLNEVETLLKAIDDDSDFPSTTETESPASPGLAGFVDVPIRHDSGNEPPEIRPIFETGGAAVPSTEPNSGASRTSDAIRDKLLFREGIIDALPQAVLAVNLRARIVFANPEFFRLFDLPAQGPADRSLESLIAADSQGNESVSAEHSALFQIPRPGEVLRGEGRFRRGNGSTFFAAYSIAPLVQRGSIVGAILSLSDLTDRERTREELEQAKRLAEESSLQKSQLISSLAHDARGSLNAISLSAQYLEITAGDPSDPDIDDSLRTIRNAVRNLLDLLGGLLDLSRIDAGAVSIESDRFRLRTLVLESVSSIEVQARAKGLRVQVEWGGLEQAVLRTDRSKLKQILCNFLSNALRYTERGMVRVFCERAEAGDLFRIGVEDTGEGIDPADHARIFNEYAQLSKIRRVDHDGGSGLGLAICLRLARLLKGEIRLKSALGEGSTFAIELPADILVDEPNDSNPPSGLDVERSDRKAGPNED